MAIIHINGQQYEVEEGRSLLEVCLSLGFDIPYFCWHPVLHSVGACRQCAVKQFRDEKDQRGFIIMSCVSEVSDGMRISTDDPEVLEFRAGIIELLMTNHPHDCPVCDEGGECHLQDMTVLTGHVKREYRFNKRTYRNQYLGPFINHEMNRCIQCYRCVRFYREYAGGRDFDVFGIHNRVYFGRYKDGVLQNEFSGNLVEVCPTGVFTDKTQKEHYTRKWDLQTAPSVCVHCGIGCNTIPGERYGSIRRIRSRYNYDVNGYFLCDRGRFGYEFVNDKDRIKHVLRSQNGELARSNTQELYAHIQYLRSSGTTFIGVGSARASLESNFALQKFIGADNFYNGLTSKQSELSQFTIELISGSGLPIANLREVSECDTAFVIGEDVSNTAPMLALALRQTIRQKAYEFSDKLKVPRWNDIAARHAAEFNLGPFYSAQICETRLDDIATAKLISSPDQIALLGYEIARYLDSDIQSGNEDHPFGTLPQTIAQGLKDSKRPLIVTGTSLNDKSLIESAVNVAVALKKLGMPVKICIVNPECNSLGVSLLSASHLGNFMERVSAEKNCAILVLENDLSRHISQRHLEEVFKNHEVIVFDHSPTNTVARAHFIVPVGTYADSDGTLVNYEGRAQRYYQVIGPKPHSVESWRRIIELARYITDSNEAQAATGAVQEIASWSNLDDLISSLTNDHIALKPILDISPGADFRIYGMKVARQSHRFSGRTSMKANVQLHEQKPPQDSDSALNFSMEGYQGQPPSPLIPRFWAPNWNSEQAINKFQAEIGGPLFQENTGQIVIEKREDKHLDYFPPPKLAIKKRENEVYFLTVHHIFGSEELSARSEPIKKIMPRNFVLINGTLAKSMNLTEDSFVIVRIGETE